MGGCAVRAEKFRPLAPSPAPTLPSANSRRTLVGPWTRAIALCLEHDDGRKTTDFQGVLQGQGGPGGSQGRPDDSPAGQPIRHPHQPGDGLEEAAHGPGGRAVRRRTTRRPDQTTDEQELSEQIGRAALLGSRDFRPATIPGRADEAADLLSEGIAKARPIDRLAELQLLVGVFRQLLLGARLARLTKVGEPTGHSLQSPHFQ